MYSILCTYVGAPCDPDKAAYHMTQMALLGAQIFIDFTTWSYSHRILQDKANKWANELIEIASERVPPPG